MKKLRIIVTCCKGIAGINTIQSLRVVKEAEFYITGVDSDPHTHSFCDADSQYIVPPANSSNYISEISKICDQEKADIIFPLYEHEMFKLLRHKSSLNTLIAGDSVDALEIAGNKATMLEFLRRKNIPCPKFYVVDNIKDFKRAVYDLGYPDKKVVFKLTDLSGCRGFRVLNEHYNEQDLMFKMKPGSPYVKLDKILRVLEEPIPKLVVMEYLEGEDYTVYSLVNNGTALYTIPMRRYGLVPGMSMGGIVERNKKIISFANRVVQEFKFNSFVNIQLLLNKNGEPMIYEINTRISATTIICTAAGVNIPYFLMKMLMGEVVPKKKVFWGVEIRRHFIESFSYHEKEYNLNALVSSKR